MSWIKGIQESRNRFPDINKELLEIEGYLEEDEARILFYKFLRQNPSFAAEFITGVRLFPFQHMAIKGMTFAEAVKELAGEREPIKTQSRTIDYKYNDAYGNEVFLVQRIEKDGKKTFRQSHIKNGKRVWSMDGVSKVLYRLDKIQDKEQVFLTEGEKCVNALVRLGFDGTTNCGGSSNWLDSYAESLRDKAVVIMPDKDEAGEK